MISSKAYKVVASGSTAAAALAAGAVVVKSERARRERGAAGGETRAGTVEAPTGQTAVTSIAAATTARSFAAFSLRLLPITAAEVFPVVYAKEAEHIVVSSECNEKLIKSVHSRTTPMQTIIAVVPKGERSTGPPLARLIRIREVSCDHRTYGHRVFGVLL